ncbi:MAG: FtsQ-type POTRA domain-containing protein [Clostridia bacterium]|nr:FtsQ-type POTRA domain-containing protein [Clostridia bacterium]
MKKEPVRDEFVKKRMERQRKIRKRRLTAFFVIFVILAVCTATVLSFTVFFPIERIDIRGSKIYSAEEILDASKIGKGDNLFALSRGKIETAIKQKLPFVDKIKFERKLPDTLKITVKDAIEIAAFKVKNKYYTVSSSGWVMEENKKAPKNLPLIICDVGCKVGSEIVFKNEVEKQLLDDFSSSLEGKNIKVNSIDVTRQTALTLELEDRFEVDLGSSNNIPEKISHLTAMMEKISPEKEGKIDLSMWSSTNTKGTFVEQKN